MSLALVPFIVLGKLISSLTKLFGSGGTTLPGLVINYLNPRFLKDFSSQIKQGSVLITGTNGKTTTARLLGQILSSVGLDYVHNRSGSNLLRGITTSLVQKAKMIGQIEVDWGLFEVDEFIMPVALENIKTKVLVINNLFRDQLDRYGEVETIRKRWEQSIRQLTPETTIILNADDPSIAHLGHDLKTPVLYFGLSDESYSFKDPPHSADALKCPTCATFLYFDHFYLSHMGDFKCPKCGYKRPLPDITAENIKILGTAGITFNLKVRGRILAISLTLPGVYNIYNTLAAVGAALALGLEPKNLEATLANFQPAFGRGEKLEVEDKKVFLALVKNPSGFNEVIRLLSTESKKKNLLIVINDLIADGRDVSWLWDVDFENLKDQADRVIVSGFRASDMALRLKYVDRKWSERVKIIDNLPSALKEGLSQLKSGETLYILPTYTAMLQTRKALESITGLKRFWED